ncbi:MAG: class I SAM-dependent methyltransferase [Planctomycetota bacterium]
MSLAGDLKILYHLTLAPVRGKTHAERLENFYRGQASEYDRFRDRLLPGRNELFASLSAREGTVWIDMGAGTGSNALLLGDRIQRLGSMYLVDLSPSLLHRARLRIEERGWDNVRAFEADATRFQPFETAVDVVTFSYSLTMIPDWYAAIDRAWELLRPGGTIGVVDFFVSRKYPAAERRQHSWFTRHFWPAWFGFDGVHLHPDHLPYLERRFATVSVHESYASVPYLPGARVPYYRYIGKKR